MEKGELNQYAPLVIFAFNRVDSLSATVASLKKNPEAADSDLFVFVDGPRANKPGEDAKVEAVRRLVRSIDGFKSVTYSFAISNKGLAPSIISGVTEVISKYGTAIVVEDDLYVSKSFLKYMNQMLDAFRNDERVFQVSGYCPKLKKKYSVRNSIFLNGRAQCWSWATWADRWNTIDWKIEDFNTLKNSRKLRRSFNRHGSDMFGMLNSYMCGRISSWFIRFAYSMHKQKKFCVCPTKSLVRNDGFTGEGTHCNNYNRYEIQFEDCHVGQFVVPDVIMPNFKIQKDAIKYWSIPYRIYGKGMTILFRLLGKQMD